MAAVARAEGDDETAAAHLDEAEKIGRAGTVPGSYLSSVLRGLGELAAARGDLADAHSLFEESLSLARNVSDELSATESAERLASLGGPKPT